jgi:DnaJ-class molecular chaperone
MPNSSIFFNQIHSNYRKLAKECHPDLHPTDPLAAEKFNLLNLEYNKCLNTIFQIKIAISLQDSILGCERYFMSNDGNRTFRLSIPAGIKTGESLCFRNIQLEEDRFSILQAKIKVEMPNDFIVIADKLIQKIRVSFWKSIVGGEITIIGPDGVRFRISIPKRCKSKTIYRIPDAGLFNRKTKLRGDLFIQLVSFFS